jgi:gas vesicle protein
MPQSETNANWKTKMLIVGALIGAIAGAGTAFLMAREAEKKHNGPPQINTADALRIGVSAVGLVRGIIALSDD